jgi:hypothetical protein
MYVYKPLKTYILRIINFLFIFFALNLQEHSYIFTTNSQGKKPRESLLAVLSRVVIQCSPLHIRARFYNKRL